MFRLFVFICFFTYLVFTSSIAENIKTINLHTESRIVNGTNAVKGQFPWQVGIYIAFNDTEYWFCGGSIISEEWVITAAHCLDNGETAYIYMGTVDFTGVVLLTISSDFIQHEKYDNSTLSNDVGLIKMKAIHFSDVVGPIALSSDPLVGGEEIIVSGYGTTSDADQEIPGDYLYYINITTITNSECAQVYGDAVLEDMVCAGGDSVKGTCYGDIGSPAVINVDTDPELVAIATFIGATGCEAGTPSGFTRIAYHRDWIGEKTGV